MISEAVAYDEEARDAFHEMMQWPAVAEVEQQEKMDQSARHAAQLIGSGNVDAMFMRAWEAKLQREAHARAERGLWSSEHLAVIEAQVLGTSPRQWADDAARAFDAERAHA